MKTFSVSRVLLTLLLFVGTSHDLSAEVPALYETHFRDFRYGSIPDGWRDMNNLLPNRNWAVDGLGFVRPMLKRTRVSWSMRGG